jgi:hypothetical protein
VPYAVGVGNLKLPVLVAAFVDIYSAVPNAAYRRAASGVLAKVAYKGVRYKAALVGGEEAARRSLLKAVFEQHAAYEKEAEHMGVFRWHNIGLSLFSIIAAWQSR